MRFGQSTVESTYLELVDLERTTDTIPRDIFERGQHEQTVVA